MARKALSQMKKAQLDSQERALLHSCAIKWYHTEQVKEYPEKKLSFRGVCKVICQDHKKGTRCKITLNHNTLSNLVKGGHPMAVHSAEKWWLNAQEEKAMVQYIIELGKWGWPLDYCWIKEHADKLGQAWLGSKFPDLGVGVQWPYCFVKRHSDQLQSYCPKKFKVKLLTKIQTNCIGTWLKTFNYVATMENRL